MRTIHTPGEMREWSLRQQATGKSIGFVPTMGALHQGHASLIQESVKQNDVTVVSVFVNPAQFGPNEDFTRYPRPIAEDSALVDALGADVLYNPCAMVMYPRKYVTYVNLKRLTENLCGASRPNHFKGVATIVTKLFNTVLPDRAYFGQKDAQQVAVLKRMVRDLSFGIEMVEMPIVREPDGLAMSSRNKYLSEDDRKKALCISKALFKGQDLIEAGERDPKIVKDLIHENMAGIDIEYVEIVDADEIEPVKRIRKTVLVAVAARIGSTRLIDNFKYTVKEDS